MTIDRNLQYYTEQAIKGFTGAAVVLERDTGRVLAMASSPSFDSNMFSAGNPNGPGLPKWPQFKDAIKDKAMVLGDTVQVEASAPVEKNSFYAGVHAKLLK